MLQARDLTVKIGRRELVVRQDVALSPGKIVGLVAPNGSGKTSFMRALIGDGEIKMSGEVRVDDVPLCDYEKYRRLVFYVPGDASILYPLLTVRDNLKIVQRCWGRRTALDRLAKKCAIDVFLDKRVRKLSLGMKQQVALAVGYMTGARYLLLDEPMNALDPTNLELNSAIIRSLCSEGTGVLMSSHILGNVDDMADDVLFIKDRKFVHGFDSLEGAEASYRRLYG